MLPSTRLRGQDLCIKCAATQEKYSRVKQGESEAYLRLKQSPTIASNGNGIRMRSLEPSYTLEDNGNGRGRSAYVTSPTNGRSQVIEAEVLQPQRSQDIRSNGNGRTDPVRWLSQTSQISQQNPFLTAQPRRQDTVLPAELAADLATEAGSREFVMDSEFKWAQENYNSTQRSIEIWSFIILLRSQVFLLDQKWTYIGGFSEERKSKRMRSLASWTLEKILQLGPTFIKLGQLFSTRSDLFPSEFTTELSKLQDRVPAFTSEKAVAIIEKELGKSVSVLFKSFERRPIAAASLGQVHRATLHSGEQVVVKVQRPGLRKLFDIDMDNMGKLATVLDKTDSNRDCTGIYKETRTILFQEIDYINEGKNADRFRRNFQQYPWVRIPKVSWQFTSPSVITLEYLPGIKISDVTTLKSSGLDLEQIATKSTEAYIIQVLNHGFLHSDPHSGNLAVSSNGQLIWYDFGMMSEIAPYTKDRLLELFYAISKQDPDAVISGLTALGIIIPMGDTLSLKRAIAFFLENINKQAERQETLGAIGEDLFSLAVDQPFRFPAAFTFVLRAFTTLEGIGKLLVGSDSYSFAAVAQPYAQSLLDKEAARDFTLQRLTRQASEISLATAQMPTRIGKIEKFAKSLEDGSLKLRVRDSATERAMRRSRIMQMTTVEAIGVAGLINVGTQLQLAGKTVESYPIFGSAAILSGLILWGFRRISKLDKFEKQLKSGGGFNQ